MKRQKFISLLGGAAAAWPLASRAQQVDRVRRIGVFAFGAEGDPAAQACVRALRQGLEQLGWIEGRNIRVDYRWASGARRQRGRRITDGQSAWNLPRHMPPPHCRRRVPHAAAQ